MAHTHPGNEADYLKHVVLEDLLKQICQMPGVTHLRYIDPYSGEGIFKNPHIPTVPAEKVKVWRDQQSDPVWYLGSPLVALQVLNRCGLDFSLRLSDKDGNAVKTLRKAVKGEIPNYMPLSVPEDTVIHEAIFNPDDLGSSLKQLPSAVNVVLLDPTRKNGYITTIDRSIKACRSSGLNAVLMCWGLHKWKWPSSFLRETAREKAEYLHGTYPSVVHLLWFGCLSDQLAYAVRASIHGW